MSGPVSRVTLPEEFFDITSSMLLQQPEPQYLFAQLWKASMGANLSTAASFGMPGREIGGVGAAYAQLQKDRLQLAQELFDGLFAAKLEMGGQPGHTVRINRPKYQNTTYTKTSRKIGANQSISTQAIGVGSEQVLVTLERFAGPYDQDNSRVAPYGIDAFDASMGVHRLSSIVGNNLQRDFDKFLDSVHVTLADTGATVVRPGTYTADNDFVTPTTAPLDYDTLNRAEEAADTANLPVFPDGHRLLLLTPTQARQVKNDGQFARYSEFHKDMNALYPGYLTTVNKMHVFKSTTLSVVANGSGVNVHRGMLLCPGTFNAALGGEGRTAGPRTAYSSDDNYGETAKVIWLMYSAHEIADDRFAIGIRTSA